MKSLVQNILGAVGLPFLALLASTHAVLAACQPAKITTDLSALRLGDEASVERALGKIDALPIGANNKGGSGEDFPQLVIYNKSKTEQAFLTKHPGDTPGSFLEVEVQATEALRLIGVTLDAQHLATEKGLKLGVTESFVTKQLGSCFNKTSAGGATTLEYTLDDMRHPDLKRVNMPNYYGRYIFRGGKFVAFQFGSELP